MQLKDMARHLPEEIWALFEPILPARIGCGKGRPPKNNRDCFHALLYVLVAGIPWELLPAGFPSYKTVQRRLTVWLALDVFHPAWWQLGDRDQLLHGINWDQVLLDGSKKPAKKGANKPGLPRWTGPNAGLPCSSHATVGPCLLGAAVTSANASDGCHTKALLAALVVPPPALARPLEALDVRSLPTAQADGAYGNRPSRARAHAAGFRLQAPARGQRRPGVSRIRQAVERRHNFFAQFGRIDRRLDRSA